MTFDEAIEKVEQLANFEEGKTTGNIRRDFKLELGDVHDLLNELREEYAPTVEMAKYAATSLSEMVQTFGEYWGSGAEEHMDSETKGVEIADTFVTFDQLNGILHPEIIKLVDE